VSSGPLVRSQKIVPQLKEERTAGSRDVWSGLFLLGVGCFKKVVIADSLARFANLGFSNVREITGVEAWFSSTVYCLQIYFDFSGYSDMAIGAGALLGFKIPINFRAPYRATSIIEFWQRWHITLSQFITTYLYTPLIRSMGKATLVTASVATLIAMAVAGLWHGPSWTFVAFGVIHGAALVINQWWRKKIKKRMPASLAWALTMFVVLIGFIAFRSPSLNAAVLMIDALFANSHWLGWAHFKQMEMISLIPLAMSFPLAVMGPDSNELATRITPSYATGAALVATFLISFLYLNSTIAQDFVYFAF
jgi:alginate O-acetyltransferase complex protein AlgI